jgi:hypothetical protein
VDEPGESILEVDVIHQAASGQAAWFGRGCRVPVEIVDA